MSHPPIIDAGPGLNFFSINKERLLIGVLGRISAPETVQTEILLKSRHDPRFRAAATVWRKLTPTWIQVLSDDQTPELAAAVHRITRQPMNNACNPRKTWARPWSSRTQSSPRKPGRPSRFSSTTAPEPAQQQLKSAACNDSSPVVAP
ncbi:hypothetical protein [Nocardia flavorosea]|uniref:hypothetical protein n=1 Tax=Nocardia flavorosea TaxID=53429 RepID=UPI001E48FF65|nr:hypothetical protein [Nocardia flavorosea]